MSLSSLPRVAHPHCQRLSAATSLPTSLSADVSAATHNLSADAPPDVGLYLKNFMKSGFGGCHPRPPETVSETGR
eukprot:4664667-Prymnesium_polylepis.1